MRQEEFRLGADHPVFRTQFPLETLSSAGRFLSDTQLSQLGSNDRQSSPEECNPQSAPTEGNPQFAQAKRDPQSAQAEGFEFAQANQVSEKNPTPGASTPILVAGIDLAGEDEEAEDSILRSLQPQRDSTAVAIARVTWESNLGVHEPRVEVLHFEWSTGRKHSDVLPQLVDFLKNVWPCQSIAVDSTGIGAGIASFLVGALGADLVHPFSFSAVSKSDLGYQLLGAVNTGRLKVPVLLTHSPQARDGSGHSGPLTEIEGRGAGVPSSPSSPGALGGLPPKEFSYSPSLAPGGGGWGEGDAPAIAEFWKQARLARSNLHTNQRLSWYVDPREGHDDLLIAVALAVEAARHSRPRVARSRLIRYPQRAYTQ